MDIGKAAHLKQSYKEHESDFSRDQAVRIHRAISWLARSEHEEEDPDVQFIMLWIAFNAAYAQEFGYEQREKDNVKAFLARIVERDKNEVIANMLFGEYSGAIRNLLDNKFVYQGFWQAVRNHESDNGWEKSFESAKRAALAYAVNKDAENLLSIVIERLYVLRNQLIHGGATHLSHINRDQVHAGVHILSKLVPLTITVLIADPEFDSGEIIFPVIGG